MARHQISAAKPKPEKPKAVIKAAPSSYETTHPVGSAERFLDQAAKDALLAAAAGGVPTVRQVAPAAVRAVAKEAEKYPDPLLSEAAGLPAAELAKRAARAEAYNQAMKAQNGAVQVASALMSPVGNMAANQIAAGADDALSRREAAKGGRTVHAAQGSQQAEPPVDAEAPAGPSSGPRIVINPTTFRNSKDALCVAFNEGFRLWMEANDFQPQSEPTDRQRKFFSDTAYADDEVQLRRTILARIATFDTSVKDPTDDQLSETASFLNAVLESDWCRNDWERNSVAKLARAVEASVGAEPVEPKAEPLEAREEAPLEARAALGGGETDEERQRQELAQADDQSNGQDLETESGGAPVSTVSEGSGEVVQYGADGSYLGAVTKEGEQKSPLAIEPPQAAEEEASAAGDQAAQEKPGEQQQEKPGEQQQEKPGKQQQEKPGEQQQEEKKPDRGAYSDIWTGGEEGKGRRLTKREAEWTKARIDSGVSVSDSQLALFGLSRNEQGQYVNGEGEVHQGFDSQPAAPAANPDAGLDRGDRKIRGGRRLGDFGARSLTNTRRMT